MEKTKKLNCDDVRVSYILLKYSLAYYIIKGIPSQVVQALGFFVDNQGDY
jgi:hypothetical protein